MAGLAETDVNLELLAKIQAAERLVELLEKLENKRALIVKEMSPPLNAAPGIAFAVLAIAPLLVGVVLLGVSKYAWMFLLAAGVLVVMAFAIPRSLHKAAKARRARQYEPQMYELHQAIDDTRKRLSRLESDIDRLTDTL